MACKLIYLIGSFDEQKILILMWYNLSSFHVKLLLCLLRNLCLPSKYTSHVYSCFFLRLFIVSVFIFRTVTHLKLFVWMVYKVSRYFFSKCTSMCLSTICTLDFPFLIGLLWDLSKRLKQVPV